MSTKSTSAPHSRAQLAEATKVLGTVHTTSPGPTPSARQAMCSAEVALFTATACGTRHSAANAASSLPIAGPWVSQSDRNVSTTASMSASSIHCRP